MKLRAVANFAFHPDPPTMPFNEMLGDGQAQTGSTHLARTCNIHAVKALKNPGLLRLWNPDTGVGNREHHFAAFDARTDHDSPAGRSVLDRVVQQILQD